MHLIVPNEIRYGLQERHDTYTKKLGFMIYANKPNGTYGQQVSFDGWRNKEIEPKDIGNEYQLGFVLNKGHLNKYHFGASAKFRVFHPEGFEFEISLENLSLILDHSIISYGEIQVPCCIAWEGSNVYLLPKVDLKKKIKVEYFDVLMNKSKAEKRLQKINNSGKPLSVRSLTSGKIVEDKDGNRFVVSSPTQANGHRDKIISMKVDQSEKGFVISSPFGTAYNMGIDSDMKKMFYPLTKIDTVISKDQENQFFKFVEKEDLTKTELNNLETLNTKIVLQFNENQKFVPLEVNETSINNFLQKVGKDYKDEKLSDYNETFGKVFIFNEVVKIKDKLYHIVIGQNYRFGYGDYVFEKRLKPLYEKQKALNYYCYSKCVKNMSMFFVPLTSEKEEIYAGFDRQGREMIHFAYQLWSPETPEPAKEIFGEIYTEVVKGLTELLKPLTQDEIDSQKRLYLEQ